MKAPFNLLDKDAWPLGETMSFGGEDLRVPLGHVGATHVPTSGRTIERLCSRCGAERTVHRAGTRTGKPRLRLVCLSCNQRRLKELRARNGRAWDAANPEKRRAHKAVEHALRNGTLVRQACTRCGTTEGVQAHHEDYAKPLDVVWLCIRHHAERHIELEAAHVA